MRDTKRNPKSFCVNKIINDSDFCSGNICKLVHVHLDCASFAYFRKLVILKKFAVVNIIN